MLTYALTSPLTSKLARSLVDAGAGGGLIPDPGDYLMDELGNNLTTETITDRLTA